MTTCKPERLYRFAESMRTLRGYVFGPDEDWRAGLDPTFWHGATGRLQAGDRIECHNHTHDIQFFVIVLGSNDRGLVRCDLAFVPLFPPDLKLPAPIVRPARYRIQYDGNQHAVMEVSTNSDIYSAVR